MSRQWNKKLTNTLLHIEFSQSKSDYSLFTHKNQTDFTNVLVYVDALIITWTNLHHTTNIKRTLDQKFNIKDMGYIHYFLGL